jgi:hypothetical protein
MVGRHARGKGIGAALCTYALDWARSNGYAGMQFNAVAETNRPAVEIYELLGFTIVGTVPAPSSIPTTAGSVCTSCTASSEPDPASRNLPGSDAVILPVRAPA